jgi:hypothetical protein
VRVTWEYITKVRKVVATSTEIVIIPH